MPLNLYVPPETIQDLDWHLTTPEEQYDQHYVLEVPTRLSTPGGVVLVPLVPSLHGAALFDRLSPHAAVYQFLPYGPFLTLSSFLTHIENRRRDPRILTFAIFDQSLMLPPCAPGTDDATRPERIAGQISLTKTDPVQRQAEMGAVILSPEFHRTHVMTHAGMLMLQWAFDQMALRRVQWYAHQSNQASPSAARRLGFLDEGVLRWEWVLPVGKEGLVGSEGDESEGGRHVWVLAIGWDDWRASVKEKLYGLVAREIVPRTLT